MNNTAYQKYYESVAKRTLCGKLKIKKALEIF